MNRGFSSAEINKVIQTAKNIQFEYSREDIQKDVEINQKEI